MPNSDPPKNLYKYFPPNRISTLDNAMLRYTPLGDFNDPFEGRPAIVDLMHPEETLDVFLNELPEELSKIYEKLPEENKINVNRDEFIASKIKLAKSKKIELLQSLNESLPSTRENFYKDLDNTVGILCLTEIPDNILMWSHYSDSHSGFAIEFNTHHQYFQETDPNTYLLKRLQRVIYKDTRPNARFGELEPKEFFLTKSLHWNYEREWRILREMKDADSIDQKEPFSINLFKFPKEAVSSIILGARASRKTEESIREILRSHPEYKFATLKRAIPSESQFMLHIIAI